MGCYWEISGDVVAKKGSFEEVVDLLESYGIDTDEHEDEKISFTYYGSDLSFFDRENPDPTLVGRG